jgi:hypothetical protein
MSSFVGVQLYTRVRGHARTAGLTLIDIRFGSPVVLPFIHLLVIRALVDV